jgi:LmbE family N-acetylglucosaminyl deacetylase
LDTDGREPAGHPGRHGPSRRRVDGICATRGAKGWTGKPLGASKERLADIRTAELDEAAGALALSGVELWDYPDGGVAGCDQQEITERIRQHISKLRPKAVVGWGPDGVYGHPDHIAMGACTDAAVAAMAEGDRPALYHLAVDPQLADFYREALRLSGEDHELPLVISDHVDVVIELEPDEVMMKVRAIDCHRSQLEDWRIAIRERPDMLQKGYGHEPYIAVSSRASGLTPAGLLGEFV